MKNFVAIVCFLSFVCSARASWYWPFGEENVFSRSEPRLSELMETASTMIDEAADLADEGKTEASVEKYRAVLDELDRIERENPERAKTPEFATIRNKRAYVNAKIDSMLMNQVKTNAKVVAVSDTRDLERRLVVEKWEKSLAEVREAETAESAARTVKSAMQQCSNDVEVVATCHVGAAKLCQFEDFTRSVSLLNYAGKRLSDMSSVTNTADRARLKGGVREVRNALAILALSEKTNRVEFCEGLRKVGERVGEISKQTDRVCGVARSPSPVADEPVSAKTPVAEKPAVESVPAVKRPVAAKPSAKPLSKRDQVIDDIARGDYVAAELVIREMLQAKPNSALALNLRAAMEMKQGKLDEAEATLDQAIMNNGRSYFAYYNMARLMLQKNADDKDRARKYYETGRTYGGPKDGELEALLK